MQHIRFMLFSVLVATSFVVAAPAIAFDAASCRDRLASLNYSDKAIRTAFSDKIIVLIGAPGSGKGTQADLMKAKFGIPSLSMGSILRDEVARGTDAGKIAKPYMDQGQLIPAPIVMDILKKRLALPEFQHGFIFDGVPRRIEETEVLEKLLSSLHRKIDYIFELKVPREELVRRVLNRGKTSGRADDNIEVLKKRLVEFDEETQPVLDYFQAKGMLTPLDGMGDPEKHPLPDY